MLATITDSETQEDVLRELQWKPSVDAARIGLAVKDGVVTIPKAASPAHVDENRAALDLHLSVQDVAHLNRAFPPPTSKVPLEML